MKFAVIFLFTLVVISHQQFQRPRGVIWVSPYYSPSQPLLDNYQSPYHNDQYFNQDNANGDEYYQARIGGALNAQQQQNARFFFNSNQKGVTVTITLTTPTVQSCIPATQLSANAGACRRKRRHSIRELDDSPIVYDEDTQFSINPSETLEVTPTDLPLPGIKREALQQQPTDKQTNLDASLLHSSKEVLFGDASKADHVTNFRGKRLFFNLANNLAMMASPVTSYVFVPTTILKTVNLAAAPSSVICLPAGYAKC